MRMIDSHCHLADTQFADDLDDVIARAAKAGVKHMVTIADTLDEAEACIRIAEKHPHIFATVGVHPHHAKDWVKGDGEKMQDMVRGSTKVKAIGEIGLDYHYNHSPKGAQRAVFLEQLTLSRELSLPAVIHCREAVNDVRAIISEVEPLQLVLHCCTEKWDDVAWFIEHGYMLSFTGIATYPKSTDIRHTIKECPLEKMMIETDAPYLAPQKHRGKRNEPAFVVDVAACIAKEKKIDVQEVAAQTTKNAVQFFGL